MINKRSESTNPTTTVLRTIIDYFIVLVMVETTDNRALGAKKGGVAKAISGLKAENKPVPSDLYDRLAKLEQEIKDNKAALEKEGKSAMAAKKPEWCHPGAFLIRGKRTLSSTRAQTLLTTTKHLAQHSTESEAFMKAPIYVS